MSKPGDAHPELVPESCGADCSAEVVEAQAGGYWAQHGAASTHLPSAEAATAWLAAHHAEPADDDFPVVPA